MYLEIVWDAAYEDKEDQGKIIDFVLHYFNLFTPFAADEVVHVHKEVQGSDCILLMVDSEDSSPWELYTAAKQFIHFAKQCNPNDFLVHDVSGAIVFDGRTMTEALTARGIR